MRRIVIGYERLPTIKQRIPGSIAYLHPIHLMIRPPPAPAATGGSSFELISPGGFSNGCLAGSAS
jgi:hypothetical protein